MEAAALNPYLTFFVPGCVHTSQPLLLQNKPILGVCFPEHQLCVSSSPSSPLSTPGNRETQAIL